MITYIDQGLQNELIKSQNAILKKVAVIDDQGVATPIKFPIPQENPQQLHMIIIDIRGLKNGNSTTADYQTILYGERFIDDERELKGFVGIFEEEHPDPRAKFLQERIHGVGFMNEKEYVPGEIPNALELFNNPRFFKTKEELRERFPLTSGKG